MPEQPYDLLLKYASRARPDKFRERMESLRSALSRKRRVKWVISIDENDPTMNNAEIRSFLDSVPDLTLHVGVSKNKHDAMNRDIDKHRDWRILANLQDDVVPERDFDETICADMDRLYPEGDGAVFYFPDWDRDESSSVLRINTVSIMGKPIYDYFGYVYNPAYISLYADCEYQDVLHKLGKLTTIERRSPLFHARGTISDDMRNKTERYYGHDGSTYQRRKAMGFPQAWPAPLDPFEPASRPGGIQTRRRY